METRPPKLIEAIVAKLLPPASRENVLGDLHERYTSTAHYILDALRTVPFVVASQSRRNFHGDVVMGEAWALQIGYAFNWQFDPYNGQMLLPAWILIGLTLLALRIFDAYAPPDSATQRQINVKTAMAISFAIGIGFVSNKLRLGLIPERFLTLDQAVFNFFMIGGVHNWFANTTRPVAAGLAPRLKELRRQSQEKERKAWGLSFAWLTAVFFVFLMNNSWEPATLSYLKWLMIGVVLICVTVRIAQFTKGKAGNNPFSLAGKLDGLRLWDGPAILIALFVASPVVLLLFDLALRQRLPADVTVLGWIKLAGLVALLPGWLYVRKANKQAMRRIQNEIDGLNSSGKKGQ